MSNKRRPKLTADRSPDSGTVLPCPLCHQRFHRDTTHLAWRDLYYHLRRHHNHDHAGQLAEKVARQYRWSKHHS